MKSTPSSPVRIIYDWKLARVIDNNNVIIDELFWNRISTKALVDRLSDLQSGRMTSEARSLKERFPDAIPDSLGVLSYSEWPELSEEEIQKFTEASIVSKLQCFVKEGIL